jgi:penicillin amidase
LRYIAHLSAPGLDVIGAGEPALPGISIGHNGQVAFGLTIFFIDQEDLYVYRTRPGKPDEYRYRDRWEPMEVVAENITVRDGASQRAVLRYTRHGPVVYEDPERNLAIALRAAWLEPGMSPYLGSINAMRARNWDEFLAAMNRWGLPPENLVYADVQGNIGWKPGGLAPVRPNWDGLLPVAGDGRYEWSGFRDMDELPVESNPARGWIATANHMNLPDGYPHPIGFEWIQPYRFERIREVLESRERFTIGDMAALQTDQYSTVARRITKLLAGLRSPDPAVERALALLRGWDHVLGRESRAGALYELWFHPPLARAVLSHFTDRPETRSALLDEDALYDVFEGSSVEAWLALLESPSAWPGGQAARDQALRSSLAEAVVRAEALMGSDWERWRWGRLHHAELHHPVSALVDPSERARIDVGPAERGGSGATVNSTAYGLGDFRQLYGASFRMVVDVGEWDRSVVMNSPGQSGDPRSPHYRDLFERWAADESFPLLYERARIEAAAEQRILLRPAGLDAHTDVLEE